MIYIELIMNNTDTFRIERQKNSLSGNWHGMEVYENVYGADSLRISNEYIILSILNREWRPPTLTDSEFKTLRKVLNKADKLGWFDEAKEPHSVVKF